MDLSYRALLEADKRKICQWKYEDVYEIYNLPSYEQMQGKKSGFGNPEKEKNFLGFWDKNVLVGFVNILEEEYEVFIGIGVRPELCGCGYGFQMLMDTYQISKSRYPNKPLYLEVRSWNQRAIRCYEKAGFQIEGGEFCQVTGAGEGYFYRMVKK